jgi:hypothetical protein
MIEFEHCCNCGANWEIHGIDMAQVEHFMGLIDRTHRHTLGEVRARTPSVQKVMMVTPEDE